MISLWVSGVFRQIEAEVRSLFSFRRISLNCPAPREAFFSGAIFFAALWFYLKMGLPLSQNGFYDYYNLAFDMDTPRILSMLTDEAPDRLGFKHPLILLFRPIGQVFLLAGLEAKQAALSVMAVFGAATVAIVWLFLRSVGNSLPASAVLTLMFAVSTTQIYTAIIPESYGFALFSISLVWLLAARQLYGKPAAPLLRYGASIAAAGITITNINQVFFAEATNAFWRHKPDEALKRLIAFGVVLALLCGVIAFFIWAEEIAAFIGDPVNGLKHIWWQQTKGEVTGILPVLQTYFGYSFVSPEWSIVTLPKEGTRMIDLREWNFSSIGHVAIMFWLGFLAIGLSGGLVNPASRPLAMGLILALLFNVLFHLKFQFRGSLFLYAAHMHFLVFALASGLGVWGGKWSRLEKAFMAVAGAVTILMALNNIPMAQKFGKYFDDMSKVTSCPAPCA